MVLSREVLIPRPIRFFTGLGWARLIGEKGGGIVIDDSSAAVVKFQNIDSFGGAPIEIKNRSTTNTLVVESCGVHVVGAGAGPIFMTDCPASLDLQFPGEKCWTRQLNPEGDSDGGLVKNNGADLWCLGVKHEGHGVRFSTTNHGRTEILGLFYYGGYKDEKDMRPLFNVDESSLSIAGLREIAFNSHTAYIKVREKHADMTKILDKTTEGGWIGWTLFRSGGSEAAKAKP